MKGFVKVEKQYILSAIIGFEMRMDHGKGLLSSMIEKFYDENYPKLSRFSKWRHRNKTKKEFARMYVPSFGTWSDGLYPVMTKEEVAELDWWCWNHKSKVNPLKSLYKATCDDYVLVDQDMADFIIQHKNYLEGLK